MNWQPIETAPVDGTRVLLRATRGCRLFADPVTIVGRYARGWWADGGPLSFVTHWQPLPKDPE